MSFSYVKCFLSLVSSSTNASTFYSTQLDTFWTGLVSDGDLSITWSCRNWNCPLYEPRKLELVGVGVCMLGGIQSRGVVHQTWSWALIMPRNAKVETKRWGKVHLFPWLEYVWVSATWFPSKGNYPRGIIHVAYLCVCTWDGLQHQWWLVRWTNRMAKGQSWWSDVAGTLKTQSLPSFLHGVSDHSFTAALGYSFHVPFSSAALAIIKGPRLFPSLCFLYQMIHVWQKNESMNKCPCRVIIVAEPMAPFFK